MGDDNFITEVKGSGECEKCKHPFVKYTIIILDRGQPMTHKEE